MFLFPDIARNQQHRQHHPRRYEQYQTHAQDHPQPQGPPERTAHRDSEKLLERPNRQSEKYPRSPSPRAVFPHKIHREQYSPAVPRRNSCIFCPDPNVSCSPPWRICGAEVTFAAEPGNAIPRHKTRLSRHKKILSAPRIKPGIRSVFLLQNQNGIPNLKTQKYHVSGRKKSTPI